jgi:hypothetical protein
MLQYNLPVKNGPSPSVNKDKRRRSSMDNPSPRSYSSSGGGGCVWVYISFFALALLVALILLIVLPSSPSASDKRTMDKIAASTGERGAGKCATDEALDIITGTCMMVPHYPSAVSEAIMDPDTRPCDDFYRYACGTWMDQHSNTNRGFTALALKNAVLTDAIVLNETNRALWNLFSSCEALFVNVSSATAAAKRRRLPMHVASESANARRVILDHILEPLRTIDDLPRVFGRLVAAGYTSPVTLSIQR